MLNYTVSSQSSLKESWSFGAGVSNFIINGDLKAKGSFFNLGAYAYGDKMLSPSVGFELRFNYSKMSGKGNDNYYIAYNTPLNNTRFEGTSIGGEVNAIYNISSIFNKIHKNENRKFNFSVLTGLGLHRYGSKLYNINNELIADFGDSPSKNGSTTSFYYTTALNIKYKLTSNLDLELRQNFNINEDDHLDAVVSDKSNLDFYFKTNLGIVYNLNKKEYKNYAWHDNPNEAIKENSNYNDTSSELDSDNDGVIDRYDLQEDTPKGAIVYGNGVAIDADEDGIIDLHDKCPLEYAKTSTGCLKDVDTDKDGIIDSKDECPLEYAKTSTGCLEDVDTDKDGIIDSKDECPTLFSKSLNGCPEEKNKNFKNPNPIKENVVKEEIKPILTKEELYKQKIIIEVNKKNVSHGNKDLDKAVNINDVDTSPIYPDCIDKTNKFDKTNCIISSISRYVNLNYDTKKTNSIKGKVRVLFIVKEDGSTKVVEILGNHNTEAKQELKRVLETLPVIEPGIFKGIVVPVKYSLQFIF